MKIIIKEPYWSAWKQYGWAKQWGVGLKGTDVIRAITKNELLEISIWKFKTEYTVDPNEVKKFVIENNTVHHARAGVTLWVIPESILTKVDK